MSNSRVLDMSDSRVYLHRVLLPAEGEHETWILLGVCIVLDPYF